MFAALLAACAGPGRGASGYNPNVISTEEIREMHAAGVRDLFELVSRERPRWLQVRTDRSLQLPTTILVYLNETRLGGVDALRGYPLLTVASLRYLDAAQAMLLPGAAGSAHIDGAIVIHTRTGIDTTPARTSFASRSRALGYP